jgi:glutamate synthase (NADPH/NADH) large chain
LASLGFRSIAEAVGHAEALDTRAAVDHWKAAGLDLTPILHVPTLPAGTSLRQTKQQDHGLVRALDNELIELCRDAIVAGQPVRARVPIRNVNRTVGAMLGHEVTKAHPAGLPENLIDLTFVGSAGQSFGAFVPRGITLRLEGDANDYLGKGLSGGRLVLRPHHESTFVAEEQIIAGNVIAYGATSGEIFIRGQVGERFAVRNSGASLVVEGVGDHGCEYMTGGEVVVLGTTGRNFAAGMSGGVAYVLDLDDKRVNHELVDLSPLGGKASDAVRSRVARHAEETDSAVAQAILADWESARHRFTEVMPRDYRLVLEAKEAAELQGLSEDETTAAMMGALHG